MIFSDLLVDYSVQTIITLVIFSFIAGLIDAVVGGGGLVQTPALLINFPNSPLATILGTSKIAMLSGTSVAAYKYSKRIKFDFTLLFIIAFFASSASFFGAKAVSFINANTVKPLILILLVIIAVYTFFKKDLGSVETKTLPRNKQIIFGSLIGLVVGFYDGFFGPGAGSFFALGFVVILGFEFITASAYSKIINCFTNISALSVFIRQGNYLLDIAILMAVCNILGSIVGTKIALKKGNSFVRIIFLIVVTMMILRYAYDLFI